METIARFGPRWAGEDGRAVGRQGVGLIDRKRASGGELAPIVRSRRPFFDMEVIAAVCECPALTYELLVAARDGVAVERVELDEASRPAAGLVRDEGAGSPHRRPR